MCSSTTIKDIYAIREWSPLTEIIERIPARVQRSLIFQINLNITCVDSVDDFLALGSDAGVVFWYKRKTGEMQKLKAEVRSRITCVKIVNSVEYMVAAGSSTGQVSVFQIQKEVPPDLNLSAPCTRAKPIERYTIRDLHYSAVSCCEWSKNGMKLYSGDRQGVVVLTEFDYQTHVSKSMEILCESYEIVQLNVYQKYLLVSTLYRCVIWQRDSQSGQWKLTQIGKKDRKQLIDCGGVFLKQQQRQQAVTTHNSPLLICGRPGYRLWIADTDGNVEKTLLFKEAILNSPTWEIPILNPKNTKPQDTTSSSNSIPSSNSSGNFRNLYLYADQDAFVVTHDDQTLYILNVNSLRVEAVARGFRKILDFCVCGKEIFVLEGERSLLRLAPLPEKPNKTAKVIFNPFMPPPVPILGASMCGSFESPVEYEPEEQAVINAEECFELPPIEKLDLNVPIELAVESPLAEQNRRLEIFRQIGEMDFEQSILHASGLSNSKKSKTTRQKSLPGGIVEIGHETREQCRTNTATLMEASYCNLENNGATTPLDMNAAFSLHMPDTLSPSTLQKTIAEKAKSLAEELDLPVVHLAPVTAEELVSQACTGAPPPTPPAPTILKVSPNNPLANCYPAKVNELGVQTSSGELPHFLADIDGDYSLGQPIDGICAINLTTDGSSKEQASTTLKFVSTQPNVQLDENIDSFLPDFRRACDPLQQHKHQPQSSDSNNSSEWEFLGN